VLLRTPAVNELSLLKVLGSRGSPVLADIEAVAVDGANPTPASDSGGAETTGGKEEKE
jgi:hypothetical protein